MPSTTATATPGRSHLDVITRVGDELDRVMGEELTRLDLVPGRKGRYALLDFPYHSNVGDSAIFLGELALLERLLRRPLSFVNHASEKMSIGEIPRDAALLLHGGGNFGDIYPRHQTFREDVMRAFPGRPLVQLPQSLHYGGEAGLAATAGAIAEHGAFTLLTRDHESLDLAQGRFGCRVRMCPDMAFALGPLRRRGTPRMDVLYMLRGDVESRYADEIATLPEGATVEDWLDEPADTHDRAARRGRLAALRALDVSAGRRRVEYFRALAEVRMERGLRQLSRARVVVSDRLHVHVLCTLLGIPHVTLDNSYGKIRRFSTAFGTDWSGCLRAETLREATHKAGLLLEGQRDAA